MIRNKFVFGLLSTIGIVVGITGLQAAVNPALQKGGDSSVQTIERTASQNPANSEQLVKSPSVAAKPKSKGDLWLEKMRNNQKTEEDKAWESRHQSRQNANKAMMEESKKYHAQQENKAPSLSSAYNEGERKRLDQDLRDMHFNAKLEAERKARELQAKKFEKVVD